MQKQIAEVIFQTQFNIRYVLTSCLLCFCDCTFDEPYSFSWFSYPWAVIFWELIAGSLVNLFSFLLFQKITCAVLVGGGDHKCVAFAGLNGKVRMKFAPFLFIALHHS